MEIAEIVKIQNQYFQRVAHNQESTENSILILGMGRNNMGDASVGAHVIGELNKLDLPPQVFILDGGAGNYDLMQILATHDITIVVDAIIDGKPAGTQELLFPESVAEFPSTVSSQHVGIKDVVSGLSYMGDMPEIALFTISVDQNNIGAKDLSPVTKAAIPDIVNQITQMIPQILAEM